MIVWNRVTWYSRYLALIFFTIIFPLWAFYLGTQYQSAKLAISDQFLIPSNIQSSSSTPVIRPEATTTSPKVNSGITGNVTIGPTCPVERIPPDPNCEDKPYQANLIAVETTSNKQTNFKSSEDGTFKVDLLPGEYLIKNANTAILPRMSDYEVTVSANKYTELKLEFDSGIR